MSISVKDLSSAEAGERYATNPALTLAKKVNRTQKEQIEQVKEEALDPRKDEKEDLAAAEDSAKGESGGDSTSQDKNPQSEHVSIVV